MRDDDQKPPNGTGFFDSFDAVAHLVRNPGAANHAGTAVPGDRPAIDAPPAVPTAARASIFRPSLRLPMARLHVVDDGCEDGEVVRVRGDRLVVGRIEGDVVVPHDVLMSPRHAALERLPDGGWRLTDLGSASGTFVRVDKARLRHERVIQIGATRMRFHEMDLTEAWLVELVPGGSGRRHECHAPVTTIGRSGCTITLDDLFVDELHAEIRRTRKGWRIRNGGANGLWVRLDEPVDLRAPAQFLCGEQRFVFEPLG